MLKLPIVLAESVNVKNILLNNYLTCSSCKTFSISPIHTCKNGHIVCGICEEKSNKKCPTCGVKNLSVNKFVENILESEKVFLSCRNVQFGCIQRLNVQEMKEHLTSYCDFRTIQCTAGSGCDKESYGPKDLFAHWVKAHKMIKDKTLISEDPDVMGMIKKTYSLSLPNYTVIKNERRYWRWTYFELDFQIFFIHVQGIGELFHFWITMLGTEKDSTQYKYSTTISSARLATKRITFIDTPVHSVQYSEIEKAEAVGHTVSVSYNNLKIFQEQVPPDPRIGMEWKINITLSKVKSTQ